jgi:hypothetical protein
VSDYVSVPPGSLKMGPIGRPKTFVSNHRTPHNNPEDGRICVHHVSYML